MTKKICLDFDGVLNTYDGWRGEAELFLPHEGAREFVQALLDARYSVVIHSTRDPLKIKEWLWTHKFPVLEVVREKPPAIVYVDDRAVCFTGDFGAVLEQIRTFKTHWEK